MLSGPKHLAHGGSNRGVSEEQRPFGKAGCDVVVRRLYMDLLPFHTGTSVWGGLSSLSTRRGWFRH